MLDRRLATSLWALRLVVGVQAIAFGLQRWQLPGTAARLAGVVELVAGVLVFTPLTELAAIFLTGWLCLLALPAVVSGGGVLGASNVLLAATAFALSRLTRVNEAADADTAEAAARARAGSPTVRGVGRARASAASG